MKNAGWMLRQQLATASFEIARQTNLLEHIPIEVVSLVDDKNCGPPLSRAVDQKAVERNKHFGFGAAVTAKIEIVSQ
jgi:hypothetical protein